MNPDTLPAVPLPSNWRGIVTQTFSERRDVSVAEKEVSAALERLSESRAAEREVLRPARKGDVVTATIIASHDGKPVKDGTLEHYSLLLGQGTLLPGVEEKIAGLTRGAEVEFPVEVPVEYWQHELRGKTLTFRVTLEGVRERTLPELGDDFARTIGKFENLEDLKTKIREGLTEEKRQKEKERMRILAIERLAEKTDAEIPEALVAVELDRMIAELKASTASFGMDWPHYLEHLKRTEDDLARDLRDGARRRVKFALVLGALSDELKQEPSEEEVKGKMDQLLSRYGTPGEAGRQVDAKELERYTRNILKNEKTFQYLKGLRGE